MIPILQMDLVRSREVELLTQVPQLVSGKAGTVARLLLTRPDCFLLAG